jgi:hypothetical protein
MTNVHMVLMLKMCEFNKFTSKSNSQYCRTLLFICSDICIVWCFLHHIDYNISTRKDLKVLCLELSIYIYVVIFVVDECCRWKTVNWLMLQQ